MPATTTAGSKWPFHFQADTDRHATVPEVSLENLSNMSSQHESTAPEKEGKEKVQVTEETFEDISDQGSQMPDMSRSQTQDSQVSQVVGSTNLYENGRLRLIPTPTPDPKDPLNLPPWRKWTAIGVICFFGGLSLAAEFVIASLLPVFLLEYSGLDAAAVMRSTDFKSKLAGAPGLDPLAVVPAGVTPPPLHKISLLAAIPLLSNGLASYFLVPLSIAVGRRPVLLLTATLTWAGGLWAGCSRSLESHLAARVVHGLGAGAVEALLPLIAQDLVFIHQRNQAMSMIMSSQGPIIVAIGVAAPYIATMYSWRWIYWATSIGGFVAWLGIVAFVPETRWNRSPEELAGLKLWPVAEGRDRATLDHARYGRRTLRTNLAVAPPTWEWKQAAWALVACAKSTFFPAVLWAVVLNSAFMTIQSGTGQTVSFALLAAGIPYKYTGLSVVSMVLATPFVYAVGGPLADRLSLWLTRRLGRGRREPEYLLPNLAAPLALGVVGPVVFGYAAQHRLHYAWLLFGNVLALAGSLACAVLVNTFVIESYPQLAGPVLVNVSSLRIIISFATASNATVWLQQLGPQKLLGIFSGIIGAAAAVGLPVLFFAGKKFRRLTAGSVRKARAAAAADEVAAKDALERQQSMAQSMVTV
ncbi:major facilitator superfamily transporter [Xylariomycetidae sp. FL0641]|nr:major facilitator superfamily transporter [Xylariomycetidae sp. FL0641]